MNDAARLALLQEILAGLIERGRLAPLPEQGTDAPLRLAVLPTASISMTPPPAATRSPSRARKPSR
jgi:hypothetical protein